MAKANPTKLSRVQHVGVLPRSPLGQGSAETSTRETACNLHSALKIAGSQIRVESNAHASRFLREVGST